MVANSYHSFFPHHGILLLLRVHGICLQSDKVFAHTLTCLWYGMAPSNNATVKRNATLNEKFLRTHNTTDITPKFLSNFVSWACFTLVNGMENLFRKKFLRERLFNLLPANLTLLSHAQANKSIEEEAPSHSAGR